MPLPDAAAVHYRTQKEITEDTVRQARRSWARIDGGDLTGSWLAGLRDEVFVQVSVGQLAAAAAADPYLDAVLAEQRIGADRSASVSARGFAGRASDARSLDTLLLEPVIATKVAIAGGATVVQGLSVGEVSLVQIVATQVQDAGRTAVGVGMVARPAVTTWTRYLSPPSCSRCVVLAGKVYRWNEGFLRHPRCDCKHVPTAEAIAGELITDPRKYFDSLTDSEQADIFTAAGAKSIRDGADIGQVVNARRKGGMYQANGRTFTTEGTSKRGFVGKTQPGVARPAPETIYDEATDRADALEQLRRFGYLA